MIYVPNSQKTCHKQYALAIQLEHVECAFFIKNLNSLAAEGKRFQLLHNIMNENQNTLLFFFFFCFFFFFFFLFFFDFVVDFVC